MVSIDNDGLTVYRGQKLLQNRVYKKQITGINVFKKINRRIVNILLGGYADSSIPGVTLFSGPRIRITDDAFSEAEFNIFIEKIRSLIQNKIWFSNKTASLYMKHKFFAVFILISGITYCQVISKIQIDKEAKIIELFLNNDWTKSIAVCEISIKGFYQAGELKLRQIEKAKKGVAKHEELSEDL